MALLDHDKALVKKYKLTNDHELDREDKASYVETQLTEIKWQIWRSRVDALLNRGLTAKDEDEEVAIAEQIRKHEKDVDRFAEAVTLLTQLKKEL